MPVMIFAAAQWFRHFCGTTLLVIGLSISALVGCSKNTLTERPPEGVGASLPLAAEPSVVNVAVELPKDEVFELVKAQLPPAIHFSGPWKKYFRGHRLRGNFSVNVPGIVWSVSGTGSELRISAPFRVRAQASVSGGIGGMAGSKNIRADFNAAARVSLQMDDQWCPRVVIAPEAVVWNDNDHPQIELLRNFWVTRISRGEMESQLRTEMARIAAQVNAKIPCASLHANLKKLWKTHAVPIPGISTQPGFAAYITPQEVSLDLPSFNDKTLHAGLRLKALTVVGTSPPTLGPGPLPNPMLKPIEKGHALLNLPMAIPYVVLASTAREKLPQKFQYKVGGTTAEIRVSEIEIYPSNGRVAVGLNVAADVPGKWLDVGGRVWLLGEPVLDVANQTLALKSVSLARKLDNSVWQALSIAFDQSITEEVMKAAQVDLKPQVTSLREKLAKGLIDANSKMTGVKVGVENVDVKLMQVTAAQDLLVVAQAKGDLSVGLDLKMLMAPNVVAAPAEAPSAPKPAGNASAVATTVPAK